MPNSRSHHRPTFLDETRSPVVRFCHRVILLLILLTVVYSVVAQGTAESSSQGALTIAVAVAAIFWAIRMLVYNEVQVTFSPLAAPLVLGGVYVIVRYALAEVEPIGRPHMLLALTGVLYFFVALNDIRHRWQVTTVVWLLTGLGVWVALHGCWQFFRDGLDGLHPPIGTTHRFHATGPFTNAGDYAACLHVSFAVAAANFLLSRRSRYEKFALAAACGLIAIALFLTFSPILLAGWVAMLPIFGYFVIRKRGWRMRWLIAGVCSIALVITAVFVASPGLRGAAKNVGPSWRALWSSAVAIGRSNLWTGRGAGMFPWLYPSHRTSQAVVSHCPNQYFQVWSDYGLIGLGIFSWVILSFLLSMIHIVWLRDEKYTLDRLSNRYAFAVAGLAACVGLAVHAVIHLNLNTGGTLFPMLTLMATALTCGVHRRANEDEPQDQPGRYVALRLRGFSRYILVAGIAGLIILIATRLRKEYPSALAYQRGQLALTRMDWEMAEDNFQRAWNLDDRNFLAAEAMGDLLVAQATWNSRSREGLNKQAHIWYNRVKTLNQHHHDVLIKIGRLHDLQGKKDLALAAYQEALNSDPRNASYHVLIGQYYLRENNLPEAERHFHIARDLGAPDILPTDEG